MWLLLAVILLTVSGVWSARHWLYGWHREDLRRQRDAVLIHLGLTALLSLYSGLFGMPEAVLTLGPTAAFSVVLGLLLIKRDPPRELSRAHLRTSTILER